MDEEQLERWRKVRANGQLRYALFYGGVIWGIPSGLLFAGGTLIFQFIWNHAPFSFNAGDAGRSLFEIAVFYFEGCVLGWLMWNRYEREYSKSVQAASERGKPMNC